MSIWWVYLLAPFPRNGQNMAILWPKHDPHMILQMGSFLILILVPKDVPCQISHCWVYPVAPFPRNSQNVALLWQKHGLHKVLQVGCSWILVIVTRDVSCKSSHCWVYPVAPFPKNGQNMALCGQNMVLIWSFMNDDQCAEGFLMPNFTILGVCHSPLSLKMAKIWPFYSQNMVPTWSFKLVLPES